MQEPSAPHSSASQELKRPAPHNSQFLQATVAILLLLELELPPSQVKHSGGATSSHCFPWAAQNALPKRTQSRVVHCPDTRIDDAEDALTALLRLEPLLWLPPLLLLLPPPKHCCVHCRTVCEHDKLGTQDWLMQQYPTAEELYDDVEEDDSPFVSPADDPPVPPVSPFVELPWLPDTRDDAVLDPALLAADENPWDRLWEEAALLCWPLWSLQQHAPPSAEHAGATASHAPPSMTHPSTVVHDVPRGHACCDMDDETALA